MKVVITLFSIRLYFFVFNSKKIQLIFFISSRILLHNETSSSNQILHSLLPTAWISLSTYEGGSKSFRPDHLFKVTQIKQLCYFSAYSPFISTHIDTDTLTPP